MDRIEIPTCSLEVVHHHAMAGTTILEETPLGWRYVPNDALNIPVLDGMIIAGEEETQMRFERSCAYTGPRWGGTGYETVAEWPAIIPEPFVLRRSKT
jgi:hypothetical protein